MEVNQRAEALEYIKRECPQNSRSKGTLARRLRNLNNFYDHVYIDMHKVEEAVREELACTGRLPGCKAMIKKIRMNYNLNVSQEKVYNMMHFLDADNLAALGRVRK